MSLAYDHCDLILSSSRVSGYCIFVGEVFELCIGLRCRAEIVGSGLKAFNL